MDSILDVVRYRLDRMSREELEELNRLLDQVGLQDLAKPRTDAQPGSRRSDPAPWPEPAREDF